MERLTLRDGRGPQAGRPADLARRIRTEPARAFGSRTCIHEAFHGTHWMSTARARAILGTRWGRATLRASKPRLARHRAVSIILGPYQFGRGVTGQPQPRFRTISVSPVRESRIQNSSELVDSNRF